MINAILTGMTGRISNVHREHTEKPVQKQVQEEKAPGLSDSISLSKEALELYSDRAVKKQSQSENYNSDEKTNPSELSEDQRKEVEELKKRDKEVRAHEQAHMVAGAPYTYGIKYEYQKGPDSKNYAVSGSVQIDTRKESTPEKNLEKAQIIKRSAQAPADPSAQDKKVLAAAIKMEQEARAELQSQGKPENSQKNQSAGIAMYQKYSGPTAGSTINFSY